MPKYHRGKDGSPQVCKAKMRACPMGGDEQHFSTEETCQMYCDKYNEVHEYRIASCSEKLNELREEKKNLFDKIEKEDEKSYQDYVADVSAKYHFDIDKKTGFIPLEELYSQCEKEGFRLALTRESGSLILKNQNKEDVDFVFFIAKEKEGYLAIPDNLLQLTSSVMLKSNYRRTEEEVSANSDIYEKLIARNKKTYVRCKKDIDRIHSISDEAEQTVCHQYGVTPESTLSSLSQHFDKNKIPYIKENDNTLRSGCYRFRNKKGKIEVIPDSGDFLIDSTKKREL